MPGASLTNTFQLVVASLLTFTRVTPGQMQFTFARGSKKKKKKAKEGAVPRSTPFSTPPRPPDLHLANYLLSQPRYTALVTRYRLAGPDARLREENRLRGFSRLISMRTECNFSIHQLHNHCSGLSSRKYNRQRDNKPCLIRATISPRINRYNTRLSLNKILFAVII